MSYDLNKFLDEISRDGPIKTAEEEAGKASTKQAHQPEMGMPPGGMTRSPMDGMIGNTQHDMRARAEELALERAGRELEMNTFDDPREAANARNLAEGASEEVKSPSQPGRSDTFPGNKMLAESPAQKAASERPALSFADYVEKCAEGEEGVKTASEALDPDTLVDYQKVASLYYAKGANMMLGFLAESLGV